MAELRSYVKTHSYHKMIYPHWPITIRWPITVWFTLYVVVTTGGEGRSLGTFQRAMPLRKSGNTGKKNTLIFSSLNA